MLLFSRLRLKAYGYNHGWRKVVYPKPKNAVQTQATPMYGLSGWLLLTKLIRNHCKVTSWLTCTSRCYCQYLRIYDSYKWSFIDPIFHSVESDSRCLLPRLEPTSLVHRVTHGSPPASLFQSSMFSLKNDNELRHNHHFWTNSRYAPYPQRFSSHYGICVAGSIATSVDAPA